MIINLLNCGDNNNKDDEEDDAFTIKFNIDY